MASPSDTAESKQMSNEDMIALALIGLAPALVGSLSGGKTSALGGAAIGADAAAGVFKHKAGEEADAKRAQKAAEAAEAKRRQGIMDQKNLIDYRAGKEAEKPKPRETKTVNGSILEKDEKGEWKPVYTAPEKPEKPGKVQQTQFVDKNGNPLVFDPKKGSYTVGEVSGEGGASKRLPAANTIAVKGGEDAINLLNNLEKSMEGKEDLFGPVMGLIGGNNPYDDDAQAMQTELKSAAQIIGKYMEDGVLRKEDEAKYEKMLPNLKDTPETAKVKIKLVRKMLQDKHKSKVEALHGQGYDVRGVQPKTVVDTPLEEMTDEELDAELERLKGGQ